MAGLVLAWCLSSLALAQTVTDYPLHTIGGKDTFITQTSPYGYFGRAEYLLVGGTSGYLYWGMMSWDMTKLPTLASGDKAELVFYGLNISGYSPTEMQLGMSATPWTDADPWKAFSWYSTLLKIVPATPYNNWMAVDITNWYNYWKNGQIANNGILFLPTTSANKYTAPASTEVSNLSIRPFVRVTKATPPVVVDLYRFLSFPLKATGFTDWKTAPITSVMDHSKTSTGLSNQNGVVMTWSGMTASGISSVTSDKTCRSFDGQTSVSSIPHLNGVSVPYVGAGSCGGQKTLSYDGHTGIDYPVGTGTSVYAAADGVVVEDECDGSVGLGSAGACAGEGRLIVKSTILAGGVQKTFYIWYMHLSKAVYQDGKTVVKKGDTVTTGQQIGLSGNTSALNIAPHLHFEVRVGCGAASVRANGSIPNCANKPLGEVYGASVDPFGWTGQGSDPLASSNGFQYWYQVEGFTPRLLWK